jgi:hypothetical protein
MNKKNQIKWLELSQNSRSRASLEDTTIYMKAGKEGKQPATYLSLSEPISKVGLKFKFIRFGELNGVTVFEFNNETGRRYTKAAGSQRIRVSSGALVEHLLTKYGYKFHGDGRYLLSVVKVGSPFRVKSISKI